MILYTDGITDEKNSNGEFYGEDKLINFLNKHKSENNIITELLKDIGEFTSHEEQFDDMTYYGKVTINVSMSLVVELNKDKWKHHKEWEKEINKNLKGCTVSIDSVGTSGEWYICFSVEFDDVDPETEDW